MGAVEVSSSSGTAGFVADASLAVGGALLSAWGGTVSVGAGGHGAASFGGDVSVASGGRAAVVESAGVLGAGTLCSHGTEPNTDKTACVACAVGTAGTDGSCTGS